MLHGNFDRKSINEDDVENFILNSVLPVSMAGATNHGSLNLLKEEEQMTRFSVRIHTNYEILTGSSAEGLCLPEVTVMKGSIKHKHFTYAADSDIKYVFTSLIVDNQNKRAFAFLDSSKSHPSLLDYSITTSGKPRVSVNRAGSQKLERDKFLAHLRVSLTMMALYLEGK